jgi:uncharacterized protein
MTPDVNVLVAAFREGHVHHVTARAWLSGALADCSTGSSLEILPMIAAGFVRLVTDSRIFASPSSALAAHQFLNEILVADGASLLELGREWDAFEKLCTERSIAGPDVPDAWIAAAVTTYGLHLVTFDADFRRLLRSDQFTLLVPRSNLKEEGGRYDPALRLAA